MSNKPIYSAGNKPIYSAGNKPVHSDFVLDASSLYISLRANYVGQQYSFYNWGYGPTHWASQVPGGPYGAAIHDVVYTDTTGAQEEVTQPPGSNLNNGPLVIRVNIDALVANAWGKGNDGTNDYYEVFFRAWAVYDYTDSPYPSAYYSIDAWCGLEHVSGTGYLPKLLPDEALFWPTPETASGVQIARFRWTPTTLTLSIF